MFGALRTQPGGGYEPAFVEAGDGQTPIGAEYPRSETPTGRSLKDASLAFALRFSCPDCLCDTKFGVEARRDGWWTGVWWRTARKQGERIFVELILYPYNFHLFLLVFIVILMTTENLAIIRTRQSIPV